MNFSKQLTALSLITFLFFLTSCEKTETIGDPIPIIEQSVEKNNTTSTTSSTGNNNYTTIINRKALRPGRNSTLMQSSVSQNAFAHFVNESTRPLVLYVESMNSATGGTSTVTRTLQGGEAFGQEYKNILSVKAGATSTGGWFFPILKYEIYHAPSWNALDWVYSGPICFNGQLEVAPTQYMDCLWDDYVVFSSEEPRDVDIDFTVNGGDHALDIEILHENGTMHVLSANSLHSPSGHTVAGDFYDVVEISIRGEKTPGYTCDDAVFSYSVCYQDK